MINKSKEQLRMEIAALRFAANSQFGSAPLTDAQYIEAYKEIFKLAKELKELTDNEK